MLLLLLPFSLSLSCSSKTFKIRRRILARTVADYKKKENESFLSIFRIDLSIASVDVEEKYI